MVATGKGFVVLLSSSGVPSLPVGTLTSARPTSPVWRPLYQRYILLVILCLLSSPVDAQRLGEDDVDEDEASLRVPTPAENTPSFCCQDFREPAPYYTKGCGVLSGQLRVQIAPTTPTNSVVWYFPAQVQPIILTRLVSIDSLQQQVRPIGGKVRQFCDLLFGGHVPPSADRPYNYPPQGPSPSFFSFYLSPLPFLFSPLLVLFSILTPSPHPLFLNCISPPSSTCRTPLPSGPPSSSSYYTGRLSWSGCRGLVTMWASPLAGIF